MEFDMVEYQMCWHDDIDPLIYDAIDGYSWYKCHSKNSH